MLNKYYIFLTCIKTYNHHKTKSLVLLLALFYQQEQSSTERWKNLPSSHSYYMAKLYTFKPWQSNSYIHALIPMLACNLFLKEWMNVLKSLFIFYLYMYYIHTYAHNIYVLSKFYFTFNFSFLSHTKISLSFFLSKLNWSFNPRRLLTFFFLRLEIYRLVEISLIF